MPELPDITAYVEALGERAGGATLVAVRLKSAFVLRSVHPPLEAAHGRVLTAVRRLGKRIVLCLEEPAPPVFLVMLLMRAGRLSWVSSAPVLKGRRTLAAFDFTTGTAVLTEAGTTRRASLYVVEGTEALALHDPGGLEILAVDAGTFGQRLQRRNHTLKRALTDPSLLAGVGGAYADEILHHARLSPTALTQRLREDEVARLYVSSRHVLQTWTERLRRARGGGWPVVTAFREGMAVHGRYGLPCPTCGHPVQRIVLAETETNYCAPCQTDGRILADRALSRVLRKDWPRTLSEWEDLEERQRARRSPGGQV